MKSFASLLPALGLIAAAQAWKNETVWTTVTTDIYTTFCPESTTFVQGTKTYTATKSETLTITDCPCTISHPVYPTYTPKPTHTYIQPPPPPSKNETTVIITTTVSEYTTYCPAPTSVVQGNQTYTVTQPTTLTITNCPCTFTTPGVISTITVSSLTTYCPVPTMIVTGGTSYPVTTSGTVTIPVISKTTVPVAIPIVAPTPGASTPVGTGGVIPPITPTNTPVGPTATPASTTGPLQANSGMKVDSGFGALAAAALAALLL